MENALTTSQPVGTRVQLMTANQEIIQAEVSASSSGGQAFIIAQTSASIAPVAQGDSGSTNLPLFTFGVDPASLETNPQITFTGFLTVAVPPGAELQAFVDATVLTELSLDGGTTWLPTLSPDPVPFCGFADTAGTVTLNLVIPLAGALSGAGNITGDVLARVTLAVVGTTAGGTVSSTAFVHYTIAQPFPT